MSWQATAWALKQRTRSPGCKLMLLTLANYADDTGCCWPSQETLSHDTEQSVDSVQRYLKKLERLGLIRKIIRPMGTGRWSSRTYFLNLTVAEMSKPQSAARSDSEPERDETSHRDAATMPQDARDHAANTSATMPHHARDHAARVRHEPSLEPSIKPSLEPSEPPQRKKPSAALRQMAFQESRSAVEVIQNRVAQKIGSNGWEVLQGLSETDLQIVTRLEERGRLTAAAIDLLRRGNAPKELA
ncbi:helix-turn-helix domain-containing protein [Tardiphaga sp.]|jgi:hypothetical protein|uniref:helix-turn-helix domain-containing protein n=1 Tax=Tardiphaga sp. TaxID=1926292 RepID=UPI0037DA1DBD